MRCFLLCNNACGPSGYIYRLVTNFSVLPAGNRNNDGSFNNQGNNANFWSSSENNSNNAWNWNFNNSNANVNQNNNNKNNGFSVRCLKDSIFMRRATRAYSTARQCPLE